MSGGGEPLGPENAVQIMVGDMGGPAALMVHVRYGYPIDKALREMAVLLGQVANQATDRPKLDEVGDQ